MSVRDLDTLAETFAVEPDGDPDGEASVFDGLVLGRLADGLGYDEPPEPVASAEPIDPDGPQPYRWTEAEWAAFTARRSAIGRRPSSPFDTGAAHRLDVDPFTYGPRVDLDAERRRNGL